MTQVNTVLHMYIASICKGGPTDHIACSQAINNLFEDQSITLDKSEIHCTSLTEVSPNHILTLWFDQLKAKNWWMPWMDHADNIGFYCMGQGSTEVVHDDKDPL